jgi:transcriptional regulator with XRE-family HTH domain
MTSISDANLRQFYAKLGSNIRSVRVSAGLSQASLAKRIGFTRASVSNLESGRQRIALHLFVQIAQVLGVEPARLLPELSSSRGPDVLKDLQKHIVDAPETAQDFVIGAVAQLAVGQQREEH